MGESQVAMTIGEIATLITELSVIFGVVIAFGTIAYKLIRAAKCQLRSDMLEIYYRGRETRTIRQYELEHFIEMYKAYKALRGNSFIDKIYGEVIEWDIEGTDNGE